MKFPSLPMLLYGLILFFPFVSAMELEERNAEAEEVIALAQYLLNYWTEFSGDTIDLELSDTHWTNYLKFTAEIKTLEERLNLWTLHLTNDELQKLFKYSKSRELYFDNLRRASTFMLKETGDPCSLFHPPDPCFSSCPDLDYVTRKERCAKRSMVNEKDFSEVLRDTYQGIEDWKAYNILIIQSAGNFTGVEGVFQEEMEVNESGSYLEASGINAAIFQTFLFEKYPLLQSNGKLAIHNFSFATKEDPITVIDNFLHSCKTKSLVPFIYYTGHGDEEGSWCFDLYGQNNKNVYISPSDISTKVKNLGLSHIFVISQSCYSGKWLEQENIIGYTSAPSDKPSYATIVGSEFTLWVCRKGTKPTDPLPQTKGDNTFNRLDRIWKDYVNKKLTKNTTENVLYVMDILEKWAVDEYKAKKRGKFKNLLLKYGFYGKTNFKACRFCDIEDETADHILFCCPVLSEDRKPLHTACETLDIEFNLKNLFTRPELQRKVESFLLDIFNCYNDGEITAIRQ